MATKLKYTGLRRGFTMAEITIVLIIISMIIGAVIAGRSVTENATAQAIIIESNNYLSAVANFTKKYKYPPGDHPEPERFFTSDAATAGDADGRWDTAAERDIAWLQLYQSGLISQKITADSDTSVATPGGDRPASRINGAGWTLLDILTQTLPDLSTITSVGVLRLGMQESTPTENLAQGSLTPKQLDYIDKKIDVGNTPLSGAFIIGWQDDTNFNACLNSSGSYTYKVESTTKCTANFIATLDN